MLVLQTERLDLRWLNDDDAGFILDLLNQPSWLKFIGDRGVRNLDDALAYIHNGPLTMIEQHGFGLYLVERKSDGTSMGLCGLLKRDTLDDVDMGFALHPDYWGHGYAREAAQACMDYARDQLVLDRLVAIVLPANKSSIKLLRALGMHYEKNLHLGDSDELLQLFAINFD